MKVGDKTRHVISTSSKRTKIGINGELKNTQEVVYKTYIGKSKGKPYFSSQTRHEPV